MAVEKEPKRVGRRAADEEFAIAQKRIQMAREARSTELNLSDLSELRALPLEIGALHSLEYLSLYNTQISDIAPITSLTSLHSLHLEKSQVSDLSPVAHLTNLQATALETPRGLHYALTPAAHKRPFNHLVRLNQPARTVETINELRRQQGLPAYLPEGYERPANIDDMLGDQQSEADDVSDTEATAALEQRPATYSFPYEGGRFYAKAQVSPPADLGLATDIYSDLKAKAFEARARLAVSNAPKRLQQTLDRLINDLGNRLEDMAPGKLLMRSRSFEADVAAYDTIEARREIAEDALSQFVDVATSVTDLKSCYPSITKLEAARLAQELLTKDVAATVQHMAELRDAAAASEIVDPSAVEALRTGEAEVKHTDEIISDRDMGEAAKIVATEKRAETAAQMLLDHRNFVASVVKAASTLFDKIAAAGIVRGAGEIASKTGQQVVKKAPGPLSDAFVAASVAMLATAALGPTVGLAAFLATYKPLAKKASQLVKAATALTRSSSTKRSATSNDDSTEGADGSEV